MKRLDFAYYAGFPYLPTSVRAQSHVLVPHKRIKLLGAYLIKQNLSSCCSLARGARPGLLLR